MDAFVRKHLGIDAARKKEDLNLTSLRNKMYKLESYSRLNTDMRSKDCISGGQPRNLFLSSRRPDPRKPPPIRSKILSGIVKTLKKFLQSKDEEFISGEIIDGVLTTYGHDIGAKRDWEDFLLKRAQEDDPSSGRKNIVVDSDKKVDWVKYAKALLRCLLEDYVNGLPFNFELNTKLLQLRTRRKPDVWGRLGIHGFHRVLQNIEPLDISKSYVQLTLDEGMFVSPVREC